MLTRARSLLAVIGALAILVAATAAGAGAAAVAADNVKPLLLGKSNKAPKTTKLANKGSGPALALKTKTGPALSVNTNAVVPNLNASLLEGKGAAALDPPVTVYSIAADGSTFTSQQFSQFVLPAGTYEIAMHGYAVPTPSAPAEYNLACLVANKPSVLADDVTQWYTLAQSKKTSTDSFDPVFSDAQIVTLPAQTTVLMACYGSNNSWTWLDSLEVTVRPVGSITSGTATPTTLPRSAGRLSPVR